jgi:ribose transport system substrate-binding protein
MRSLRILAAAAALSTFFFAGCNSGTSTAGTDGATSGKRLKIAVSIPAADHGWTAGVNWWAKEAAKLYPDVDWLIEDAKDESEQIADLQNLQAQGIDGLVILCTSSGPITPAAKKVHEAGILVVNVDRGFTEPFADFFVEGDNKAFGRKSGEYIAEKMGATWNKEKTLLTGATGNLVILRGIDCTVDTDRYEAAMKVFSQSPGINVVAVERGLWNREESDKKMQNILAANPKIDVVWAQDDDMALGAENALKQAGREKEVWMLGGAGMNVVVKRVMDGDPMFPADITYPPSMIVLGMQKAVEMLTIGKEKAMQFTPKHMMLDIELITPENAKNYYFPDSIY